MRAVTRFKERILCRLWTCLPLFLHTAPLPARHHFTAKRTTHHTTQRNTHYKAASQSRVVLSMVCPDAHQPLYYGPLYYVTHTAQVVKPVHSNLGSASDALLSVHQCMLTHSSILPSYRPSFILFTLPNQQGLRLRHFSSPSLLSTHLLTPTTILLLPYHIV